VLFFFWGTIKVPSLGQNRIPSHIAQVFKPCVFYLLKTL